MVQPSPAHGRFTSLISPTFLYLSLSVLSFLSLIAFLSVFCTCFTCLCLYGWQTHFCMSLCVCPFLFLQCLCAILISVVTEWRKYGYHFCSLNFERHLYPSHDVIFKCMTLAMLTSSIHTSFSISKQLLERQLTPFWFDKYGHGCTKCLKLRFLLKGRDYALFSQADTISWGLSEMPVTCFGKNIIETQ